MPRKLNRSLEARITRISDDYCDYVISDDYCEYFLEQSAFCYEKMITWNQDSVNRNIILGNFNNEYLCRIVLCPDKQFEHCSVMLDFCSSKSLVYKDVKLVFGSDIDRIKAIAESILNEDFPLQ